VKPGTFRSRRLLKILLPVLDQAKIEDSTYLALYRAVLAEGPRLLV
jgi:hypothetical protein